MEYLGVRSASSHFNPTPRIALFVPSFVGSSVGDKISAASHAPAICEGREERSQAGPKGHQIEVGARRAP